MKRKKAWLRWIAWMLLLVLCMNSAGTTAMADSEEENIWEGFISEEEFTSSPEELSPFPEETSETEGFQGISEGVDIDFYVIIDGNKVKLQHNDITDIATWKSGRTNCHGVSIEDLLLIYEEFGFVKNSEDQNPDATDKFVSAYREESEIEYGEVYTDIDSGKTYVSYNSGQNKQGEAVDVYYLPNGKGSAYKLKDSVKNANSFYSVEVKGEGQDRIRYALTGTAIEEVVSDFNPELPEQTDQIKWICMGADDKVIDGIRESENQTRFTIGKITQSYVVQRVGEPATIKEANISSDTSIDGVNHSIEGGVTVKITMEVTGPFGNREEPLDMEIVYFEDGQSLSKTIAASLKDGDVLAIQHVDQDSDIKITEAVDTSKYAVSVSTKILNESSSSETPALLDKIKNEAIMTCKISEMQGDVVEIKVTNNNLENDAPNTGIHLEKNLYIRMLIFINIAVVLFFMKQKKNKIERIMKREGV